jgi:hypothetical protein
MTGMFSVFALGDEELAYFLNDEIEFEKEFASPLSSLPSVDGFVITSLNGPNITLAKKLVNEV